jgi:hypothetical protein
MVESWRPATAISPLPRRWWTQRANISEPRQLPVRQDEGIASTFTLPPSCERESACHCSSGAQQDRRDENDRSQTRMQPWHCSLRTLRQLRSTESECFAIATDGSTTKLMRRCCRRRFGGRIRRDDFAAAFHRRPSNTMSLCRGCRSSIAQVRLTALGQQYLRSAVSLGQLTGLPSLVMQDSTCLTTCAKELSLEGLRYACFR